MSQFQLYRDARGEYRWRLITDGGTTIATGGEGYTSKGGAGIAIQAVKEVATTAPIVDNTGERSDPMVTAENLAQRFHETYERLAPSFGYETRKASAKPWAEVPEQNRRLMIAVCAELLAQGFTAPEAGT